MFQRVASALNMWSTTVAAISQLAKIRKVLQLPKNKEKVNDANFGH